MWSEFYKKVCFFKKMNKNTFKRYLNKKVYYKIRREYYLRKLYFVKPKVILLGNQKSGTSAIAILLSEYTKLSSTIDIPAFWPLEADLHSGKISLNGFIKKFPWYFTNKIVKEPCLTFLYGELFNSFPNTKYVFIVRHPLDNIRSILDRVNINPTYLPFDTKDVIHLTINKTWKRILRGDLIEDFKANEITSILAYRWCKAVDIYFKNKKNIFLVKYEDFLKDKEESIKSIAEYFELPKKQDIKYLKDVQFQPRGKNRDINIKILFSPLILYKVKKICFDRMNKLGYSIEI